MREKRGSRHGYQEFDKWTTSLNGRCVCVWKTCVCVCVIDGGTVER